MGVFFEKHGDTVGAEVVFYRFIVGGAAQLAGAADGFDFGIAQVLHACQLLEGVFLAMACDDGLWLERQLDGDGLRWCEMGEAGGFGS